MNISDLVHIIEKVGPFRGMAEEEIRSLILSGQMLDFQREAVIFREEEPCAGLHVLLKGQVQLCKISQGGQISILSVMDPIVMFNEVAALDGGPNPVTAFAGSPSTLWKILPETLHAFLMGHPLVQAGLLKVLASRNRLLIEHVQDLSFRSVLSRTAKLLLELSANGGQTVDRRAHPNYQLAARISTVPEALSRSLRSLNAEKSIELTKHTIIVLNTQRLMEVAHVTPFVFS